MSRVCRGIHRPDPFKCTHIPTNTTSTANRCTKARNLQAKQLVFGRRGWHRGCSMEGCRAASAARPAAPVFRWSIRPSITACLAAGRSRKTLPAPPCTVADSQFPGFQFPVSSFQFASSPVPFSDEAGGQLDRPDNWKLVTGNWQLIYSVVLGAGAAGISSGRRRRKRAYAAVTSTP